MLIGSNQQDTPQRRPLPENAVRTVPECRAYKAEKDFSLCMAMGYACASRLGM